MAMAVLEMMYFTNNPTNTKIGEVGKEDDISVLSHKDYSLSFVG